MRAPYLPLSRSPTVPTPLTASAARRVQSPDALGVSTSADLAAPDDIIGHDRALAALDMGLSIRCEGYHTFAMGDRNTGIAAMVNATVHATATQRDTPDDTVLLHHFDEPRSPLPVRVPAGQGPELAAQVDLALARIAVAVPAAFQHDAFQVAQRTIVQREESLSALRFAQFQQQAQSLGVAVQRREDSLFLAPIVDGQVLDDAAVARLPEERRAELQQSLVAVQQQMATLAADEQQRLEAMQRAQEQLQRRTAASGARPAFDSLREAWPQAPLQRWFNQAETALVAAGPELFEEADLNRWRVNVLVTHPADSGAPVEVVDDPSWPALAGRVEHQPVNGALTTHHRLVFPGALHRANGGFLLLEARRLLSHAGAWQGLKRALRQRVVRTEAPVPEPGVLATSSLEPGAVELDVDVVLIGTQAEYRTLTANDPDFALLFGVAAEFEDDLPWTDDNALRLARRLADLAERDGTLPLQADALAAAIEHAGRIADSQRRLSLHVEVLRRVLREADYLTRKRGGDALSAADINGAVAAQHHREGGAAERSLRGYVEGSVRVRTEGSSTGEVNGLAVLSTGRMRFGMASRISARVWAGEGAIVNVESESGLSGPFHDKGQHVLTGLIGGRYAQQAPLCFRANLVFEQSYNPVDGDSASMAELVALLSALSGVPVLQGRAITGSVDQNGHAQAIGGVNDKIEGFFDLCRARGLTGEQGVVIPTSNAADLMLRHDVRDAIADGRFHLWTMEDVDDAFEVLTGRDPGRIDERGEYPPNSPNARIASRLVDFAETARQFK